MVKSKVVVTGAGGFVGSKLVQKLVAQDYEVLAIDKFLKRESKIGLTQLSIDLLQVSCDELKSYIKESTVVHLAAISTSSDCENKPDLAIDVNVNLTKKIIGVSKDSNTKLIFASSEWVYPQNSVQSHYREDTTLSIGQETNLYSMTKIIGEWLIQKYLSDYCILRFGIVYGERPNPQSAPESIVNLALSSQEINIGNLNTARRFIHVEDITQGIIKCIEDNEKAHNKIFNLTGDKLVSLGEIVNLLIDSLKKPLIVRTGTSAASIRSPDSQLFYSTFNWRPEISIDRGIHGLIQYASDWNTRK